MNRGNPWNPLGRNNPLTGGNPERNWHTRGHRDAPQPSPENMHPSAPDFLRRQATGDSPLKRAGKFVRKVAELATLGQIPLADRMMFHDWLHPDGKNLDLNRATYLAAQERYYYQQYSQEFGPQRAEEAEIHFLKSFLEKLSKIGDGIGEHKHNRKGKINEEALEAYDAGKQEGEDEAYYRDQYYRASYYRDKRYRDSYYRDKDKLENDPHNDPLG